MSVSDAQTVTMSRWTSLRALIQELMRFVGLGFISFPLGIGISALCHEVFGWHEEVAVAVSIAILIVVNFTLSRVYVFRSIKSVRSQLIRFVSVALVMRGIEYGMFLVLLRAFGVPYLFAMASALVISLGMKFLIYRAWVFGSRM